MLRSVSVENYRSFVQKAVVHLRPITILLGRNSAGKSSLTRLFPLLRQSMERGTSAPILWNSSSVDFGRITDVISRQNADSPLQITFDLSDEPLGNIGRRSSARYFATYPERNRFTDNVSFTAFLRAGADGKTIYERFNVLIGSDLVRVDLRHKPTIFVNDRKLERGRYWSNIVSTSKQLFPYILFESGPDGRVTEFPETGDAIIAILRRLINLPSQDDPDSPHLRIRRSDSVIDVNASPPMTFVPRKDLINVIMSHEGLIDRADDIAGDIEDLGDLLLVTYVSSIVESIGTKISTAMEGLSYLGPIRASGNRFYREQELSVDKIDDTGENLATYIGSLSVAELKSFNTILFQSFGVEVRAHPEAGHLSIEIGKPGDQKYDNLADVGFGYSQVLPLVAQIHSESRRDKFPRPRDGQIQISAVEQPELHLHPAYQANLADLFVASIEATKSRGKSPVIILETHSESIVGRIGELIAVGKLRPEDVAVHFVDKDETIGASTVRLAEYDEDGDISDWPVGFFSAR